MPEQTRRSKDLMATILMAVVMLASPIKINAADISSAVDTINCTPCHQNPPPPPPPSSPPPPPPTPSNCPPPPSPPPSFPPPPPPPTSFPPPPPPTPSLPPPPPPLKKTYFPPPPPPTFVFASPPGNMYPVDNDFGAAAAGESFTMVKLVVFGVTVFMILSL